MNECEGSRELIEATVTFFQERSGCDAVGIRLRKGEDYPYYEARGFSDEFLQAENSLCVRDADGQLVRDDKGYPINECMCGNVINGRFDPLKPFFTQRGSFWTNCVTQLLAQTTQADRQSRTRGRCKGEGYESVALIPLLVGSDRIGILQLNDHRTGRFSTESIALWERFAGNLAVALAKLRAEEALAESEKNYRTMAESIPQLAWMARPDGYIFWYNRRWYDYTGAAPEDTEGWGWQSVHDPEVLPSVLERWRMSIATGEPFDMEFPLRGKDGRFRAFLTRVMPLKDSENEVAMWFGTSTDVSEQREAETHKREFYRRTILAATEGRLLISEKNEIESFSCSSDFFWDVKTMPDLSTMRNELAALARRAGMEAPRIYRFLGCAVEAAANAVKHARGGRAGVCRRNKCLIFSIADAGPGIGALALPDVALTKGYSTAGTLGMGYKLMIHMADKVYLATGPDGTTVAIEMSIDEPRQAVLSNE